MSDELSRALEGVRNHRMSRAELEEQRVSFVYGNAPADDTGDKESIRRALHLAQFG